MKNILKLIFNFIWHKIIRRWLQFFKFCVVGTLGAIIDIGGLWFLVEFVGFHYLPASTISFLLAVINNYFLNKYWTFKNHKKDHLKQFISFVLVSIAGLLINLLVMYVAVEKIGVWYLLAKVIASLVVLSWNFVMNKYVTFKKL